MKSIRYTVFKRNISILQIRGKSSTPYTIFIFIKVRRSFKGILTHSFISLVHIEITNPLTVCIADGGDTMIAYHSGSIAIPTRKDGQPTTLFIFMHQRLHHISPLCRKKQIDHRMQGTVGIPHTIILIIRFSFRKLAYRSAIRKRGITAIYIIECMRQKRSTIESTVKHFLVCKSFGLYINSREMFLPHLS